MTDDNSVFRRVQDRAIVALKTSASDAEAAERLMDLAGPLSERVNSRRSLWLGPGNWLLSSDTNCSETMIQDCNEKLNGLLFNAFNCSAALVTFRIGGPDAREILSSGSGLDVRPTQFPVGTCCRTRFANISAIIAAVDVSDFEFYIDRSYSSYFEDWIRETISSSTISRTCTSPP